MKIDQETRYLLLTAFLILGITLGGMVYAYGRLCCDRSYSPDNLPPSKTHS